MKLKIKKGDLFSLLVLSFFVFLSSKALFHSGFFKTIDDITTLRIVYLLKELKLGNWWQNFPVRWSSFLSHGHGYPLYLFYAPLTYYAGAILMMVLNLSHIVATKAVYVFPLLVGPYLFYWSARKKTSALPALAGSILYALFPFRGYDTYIRGGVGEAWAMAFLPGIFAGLFLIEKNNRFGVLITSLFLTLTVLSHNLSALLIFGLVLIYGWFYLKDKKDFWLSLGLGLGISAFFWLPSLIYLNIVKVSHSKQNTHSLLRFLAPLKQVFEVSFKYQKEKRYSGFFSYGLILAWVRYFWLKHKNRLSKLKRGEVFWTAASTLSLFLITDYALIFWLVSYPVSRMIQFPWRVLILLSFCLPLTFSLIVSGAKQIWLRVLLLVAATILSLSFLPTFSPKNYTKYYEYHIEDTGRCATTWGEEYLPVWVKECRFWPTVPSLEIKGDDKAHLDVNQDQGINIKAKLENQKPAWLIVDKHYFPGWQIVVDGHKREVDYQFWKEGFFRTKVQPGKHEIEVSLQKTFVMWLADLLSLTTVFVWVVASIKILRNKK